MSEAYRRRETVAGLDFVRIGDVTWAPTGDGALWQCLQCGDGRAVSATRAHAAWHARGRTGLNPPKALRPELGDREAIDDE